MSNSKEKLFSEFPPVSTEQWKEKIIADLKGADFEKKLVWRTNEGFNVQPFYREEDLSGLNTPDSLPGEFPFVRGTKKNNDWLVRQDIEVSDFSEANSKALDILNKGVNSLGFRINKKDINQENIALLLKDILPEHVELNFKTCNCRSVELITILVDYLKSKGYDTEKCVCSVELGPLSPTLKKGKIEEDWIELLKEAIELTKDFSKFRVLNVNAYLFNNAGSFIVQELGYALAWGNELISKLTEAGLDATLIAKKIKFNFGIGSNYFMEIAKFRAARWLWAEIAKAYEVSEEASKMNVFAQTSLFNQTVYDAHVNMLRTQTEAMSAGIAGVDSLLITPYDQSFKTPDDFSERIARNQQLLLKEESHFDKIVDPSAGSYYIENLTNSIAQEAWKLFVETEEKGFYVLVKNGEIQKNINKSAEKRFGNLASRKEVLLGTNQYPNFTELALSKIETKECACGCNSTESSIEKLNTKRLSSEFEELRLATEKSGKTPKAFMLTIGNLAMRLARSQFSCNFFACAGYQVIDNLGFDSIKAGIEAADKANADIIVLCSSDDEYATYAPEAIKMIGSDKVLVVAGNPVGIEELKSQGIEYFINVRSNVLETLKNFNKKFNIN